MDSEKIKSPTQANSDLTDQKGLEKWIQWD
jgi:hypothetical protein